MDLSVIVIFCGEYPQSLFTLQSINQNLVDTNIKYEVIAVNNYCNQVKEQTNIAMATQYQNIRKKEFSLELMANAHKSIRPMYEDKSGESIKASERLNHWLVYMEHDKFLSHWEAKRLAVKQSRGKYLLFVDAHTIPSHNAIPKMFNAYILDGLDKQGTIHLPLTYKILETHKLIYKLKIENKYFYNYSFTAFRPESEPYEVPCMSTCGMMISRELYDQIGGWPIGMSSYGGGENFINYTLAVLDKKKFIYPFGTLYHHGEARDYHWDYTGFVRNRMIAHYLFGGEKLLDNFTSITKGRPNVLEKIKTSVIPEQFDHRQLIKKQQQMDINQWAELWEK